MFISSEVSRRGGGDEKAGPKMQTTVGCRKENYLLKKKKKKWLWRKKINKKIKTGDLTRENRQGGTKEKHEMPWRKNDPTKANGDKTGRAAEYRWEQSRAGVTTKHWWQNYTAAKKAGKQKQDVKHRQIQEDKIIKIKRETKKWEIMIISSIIY